MNSQRAIFNSAGYPVILASSAAEIAQHVAHTAFDIAVLNHTLSREERSEIARQVKLRSPGASVLVLHASGMLGNPDADLAVDSRGGAAAMLAAVGRLEAMRGAGAPYTAFGRDMIVVVDATRSYVFVSDGACHLLGYDRSQFLELRIDDVVIGSTKVTEPLFQEFVSEGRQQGRIDLRHRSGAVITVDYVSEVQPDGYMMARWQPVRD
ncbi:MAG TPA: PAS domain-containing protein, partial [Candidatus Angelobacter sp.]|nr:PAS domain-containing protein [Candidatus Angelobacter sp.]